MCVCTRVYAHTHTSKNKNKEENIQVTSVGKDVLQDNALRKMQIQRVNDQCLKGERSSDARICSHRAHSCQRKTEVVHHLWKKGSHKQTSSDCMVQNPDSLVLQQTYP